MSRNAAKTKSFGTQCARVFSYEVSKQGRTNFERRIEYSDVGRIRQALVKLGGNRTGHEWTLEVTEFPSTTVVGTPLCVGIRFPSFQTRLVVE